MKMFIIKRLEGNHMIQELYDFDQAGTCIDIDDALLIVLIQRPLSVDVLYELLLIIATLFFPLAIDTSMPLTSNN